MKELFAEEVLAGVCNLLGDGEEVVFSSPVIAEVVRDDLRGGLLVFSEYKSACFNKDRSWLFAFGKVNVGARHSCDLFTKRVEKNDNPRETLQGNYHFRNSLLVSRRCDGQLCVSERGVYCNMIYEAINSELEKFVIIKGAILKYRPEFVKFLAEKFQYILNAKKYPAF